jgi:hypothetical protein
VKQCISRFHSGNCPQRNWGKSTNFTQVSWSPGRNQTKRIQKMCYLCYHWSWYSQC